MSRGFTLLEVLIVFLTTALVGGLLAAIMVNSTGLFYKQSSKVSQGLGLNDILLSVKRNIREAQSVASGYPEVSPVYTSGANQIVLKLSSIDSSANLIASSYDFVVYFKEDDKFKIKVFPSVMPQSYRQSKDEIISSGIESVLFEYFDSAGSTASPNLAKKVRLTLTLKQKTGNIIETKIGTSEANLRND